MASGSVVVHDIDSLESYMGVLQAKRDDGIKKSTVIAQWILSGRVFAGKKRMESKLMLKQITAVLMELR